MQPLIDIISFALVELFKITGSLGWSIIIFTFIIRSILLPLTLPSLRAQKKMKEIKPELDKLKAKHGKDKKAFQQAQLDLYKKYNVNPLAGCIPQLLQIGVLIVLYQTLINFLGKPEVLGVAIDPVFWKFNLGQPDTTFILPVVAGVSQLFLSLMIAPGGEVEDKVPNDSKSKKIQKENKKEEDFASMAAGMQQQMIFVMPVITGFIALRFPAGLALYWVATTIFSIGQQYFITGPGGLVTYARRARAFISGKMG